MAVATSPPALAPEKPPETEAEAEAAAEQGAQEERPLFRHVVREVPVGRAPDGEGGLSIRLGELVVDPLRPAVVPTGTGGHVWPSALALAEWLWRRRPAPLAAGAGPGLVLELGAGCGLPGLLAAALGPPGARVVLTDCCPAVLRRLAGNRGLNGGRLRSAVEVRGLDWAGAAGGAAPEVDLLLGADLVWMEPQGRSLARAAWALLRPGGQFLLSTECGRAGLEAFVRELSGRGADGELGRSCSAEFSVERAEVDADGTRCAVYTCTRKLGHMEGDAAAVARG